MNGRMSAVGGVGCGLGRAGCLHPIGGLDMFKAVLTAGVLALGMASASSAATVIFQDDFNTNTNALSATPSGWTVTSGTVDIIGNDGVVNNGADAFDFVPGNGVYLDMDGSTFAAGRIETAPPLNAVAGGLYRLSFSVGRYFDTPETLFFGFAGWSSSVNILTQINQFDTLSFDFTATVGGLNSLFFAGDGGDNRGALLDNVVLSQVPLPAGSILLIGGLAALAGLRRRKYA